MNLVEALRTGKFLKRKNWSGDNEGWYAPDIIMGVLTRYDSLFGSYKRTSWLPSEEDLLANDWQVKEESGAV